MVAANSGSERDKCDIRKYFGREKDVAMGVWKVWEWQGRWGGNIL